MTKKQLFLLTVSVLCILCTLLLTIPVVGVFREGAAWKAAGHPGNRIFSPEKMQAIFLRAMPVLLGILALTAAGLLLGIRDERAERPVRDTDIGVNLMARKPGKAVTEDRDTAETGYSAETGDAAENIEAADNIEKRKNMFRGILFAAAVLCIAAGIRNGSMRDVLYKAINICTECIGLG